ncbi:MAG: response regulator transcription factor [Burkholderiales bacterium]|jgi:two-component system OmpR family response regulator|nr:response regulator transcription factor [Burkholderiales bacterium]
MRVLIVEDDAVLADGLVRSLRQSGYSVDCVADGLAADAALTTGQFDLVILDLGLPKMGGLEVLKRFRGRDGSTPVLILTALDGVNDRVRGLDLGADDYLAKPFILAELEARVRALTRRGTAAPSTVMKHGDLAFDRVGKIAELKGQMLDLSARELALLEIFLQRPGRMVNKEQMVDLLCQWGEEVSTNAIEVYIHRLRKKLEPGGVRIVTVRGLGYCLEKVQAA